jgi:hypothetical protein
MELTISQIKEKKKQFEIEVAEKFKTFYIETGVKVTGEIFGLNNNLKLCKNFRYSNPFE